MSHLVKSVDAFSHQGFKKVGAPNHYNEDRMVVGTDVFAVIDGATALVPTDMDGINPSAYTAKFLAEFLYQQTQHQAETAYKLLVRANAELRENLRKHWPEVLELGKLGPCAMVSVVKLHGNKATIANAGDCAIAVLTEGNWHLKSNHYPRHAELDHNLHQRVFGLLDAGHTYAEAWEMVHDQLVMGRNLANVEYGVFNAEPETVEFLKHQEIDLTNIEAIALMSDGLQWMEADTDTEAYLEAAAQMHKKGVRNYHGEMLALLDTDPTFKQYRRLKHADDATGIVISLKE